MSALWDTDEDDLLDQLPQHLRNKVLAHNTKSVPKPKSAKQHPRTHGVVRFLVRTTLWCLFLTAAALAAVLAGIARLCATTLDGLDSRKVPKSNLFDGLIGAMTVSYNRTINHNIDTEVSKQCPTRRTRRPQPTR